MEVRGTRPYTRFQHKLDTLRDFSIFVEDFFNPYIKAAGNERSFEWPTVDKFYNDFQDRLTICYSLKIYCEFVLKLFLKFNCEHERLMIRIIQMYCRVKARTHGNFEAVFCQDCEQFKCRLQYHLNSQPLLREINEKTERFYKAHRFTNSDRYFYRRIFPSYYQEDYTYYEFLRYLVKYGLIFIPNSELAFAARFIDLRFEYYEMRRLPDRPQYDEILLNQLLFAMGNANFRRLILIMEIVANYVIIDGKHDHARSFGLYSLTVSEPAISQKEVQEFLDFSFADDETFKTNALSSFKEVFAECPKLTSPRPLKHLCRIKIRDCLPRSPPMPTLLYQIEVLPNYLKDYILFLSD